MRTPIWIILSLLIVAIYTPYAHADTILDVSGTLTPTLGVAACSPSCTLGGDIVINNTTGAVISTDVTMSGESPVAGPFTQFVGISPVSGLTDLSIVSPGINSGLTLVFATPTAGSL